jgi:hypothetical protein
MSCKTGSSSQRPAATNGRPDSGEQLFVVEIEGTTHRVKADSRNSAKYRAASVHKEQQSGPDIGRNVGEIAGIVSIVGSLRTN